MSQTINTTIGLAANATSPGQLVHFKSPHDTNVSITNNSGQSIQYAIDGATWVTVANGATASVGTVTAASQFRMRKTAGDSYPVPVAMSWTTVDSEFDPSSVAITGGTINKIPVSAFKDGYDPAVAQRLASYGASGIGQSVVPVLDLNYASRMATYGIETVARAGTDTYTDMLGASQTAGANTAAFDRQQHTPVLPWVVSKGLKTGSSGTYDFNGNAILPTSGYTLVVDCDRPVAFSGNGTFLSLNGGSVTNRVDIACNGNYQASAIVQTGGSVVFNQSLGAIQSWYGGPRRLVLSVKSGAFYFCDDGQSYGSGLSGGAPTTTSLTHFNIGCGIPQNEFFTGWIKRVQVLPFALGLADTVNLAGGAAPVACWGDSLTAGTGASGPSGVYVEQLRLSRYPHSGCYNGGVGGDTSTQIKTRMLADTIRNGWTSVFWAGRNNFASPSAVVADVQAMVGNLTHSRYVVLSVINRSDGTENAGSTNYTQILAVNAALQAAFPNNYLDIRSLIAAASGGSNDAPNASWTADGLHLNNTGYAYVGQQVSAWLAGKTWF